VLDSDRSGTLPRFKTYFFLDEVGQVLSGLTLPIPNFKHFFGERAGNGDRGFFGGLFGVLKNGRPKFFLKPPKTPSFFKKMWVF